ncbi:MAG TPA: peptidoglycan-binding domain-containing protein [Candidatus Paceibacterota bacterium]|nr:peptidoglycan-binding domain-containing protein [Candidatus Paceibacterota bacterium]
MSKVSKKLVSVALTATTTLWLTGAAAFVPAAYAQSTADLQAQIQALLAQISVLQSKLGSSSGSSMSYTFAQDLTLGSKGADVTNLQQVLQSKGYLKVAPTGYFGSLTKAALVAWQKDAGVSPASGYFGPKSRAAMNAAMAGSGAGTGGGVSVVPPASGLAVSLAADSPTGSAIANAGQIKAGKFNFTASNSSGVTITDLQFTKVGVLSDSAVSNLYIADAQTGLVVAQYQSLTNGVATFSGLSLNVAAGQTWQGELRMDLGSATAGNTIAWQLSKVTAGSATVTGMPTTNALTVTSVSNPALASLSLSANSVGSSIDAGTVSALVSSWTATVQNSAVNLQNMQFTFVGSANPSDIKNLRLLVNGTQVATLDTANTVTNFNFASSPVKLNTGSATIQIFADVLGSPNRTFTFSLLQPYRVTAIDTQYNTGVTVSITTTSQTTITINPGTMSVSLASDTPTSPIPVGASGVTLAKFRVYAAGEPVKVLWLQTKIQAPATSDWTALANVQNDLQNIKLVDDAGGQFGNTINTIGGTSNSGDCSGPTSFAITCNFGTSVSPVNYIVPANTSRALSLQADILSTIGASVTTLQGSLVGQTSNLQGQISYTTASSGAASGATLSVSTSVLTPTINSAFSAPTYVPGASGVKVASFVLTASSAQGAQVTSLTFNKNVTSTPAMQNVKVMVGSTQFGSTRTTISNTGTDVLSVSGSTPIQVAQGGSVVVDVYADILTTSVAGTQSNVFSLTGWSALGSVSNSAITFPGSVNGQSVTLSSGPTLTVGKASASAPAQQVVMGSTNNSLFTMSLSSDNVEDIRVTDVTLLDTITGNAAGIASFQNLTLYNGTTAVAGPLSLTVPGTSTGTVHFTMSSPLVVPKNSTVNLELRGDVATFSSGGAQSGSGHTYGIAATSSVIALGNSSNQAAVVAGTPTSSAATVYRTKVTLAASVLGSTAGRTRVAVDDIANLNFSADTAYKAVLGTVALKFSGQAVSNGSPAFTVDLIDANTNTDLGSAAQGTCTPGAGNSCTVTFSPQFSIDAGTTKITKVRVNSGSFFNSSQTSDSLSVIVNGSTDVLINDGTTAGVPLPGTVVPFTVSNVSYE